MNLVATRRNINSSRRNMNLVASFIAFVAVWCGVVGYSGPVYVNPAAVAEVAPSSSAAAPAAGLVTQTVYGFLDFTTTIGNTVMVFSPQSAPPAEPPKKPSTPKPAIETKPSPSAPAPTPSEIRPSPASLPETKHAVSSVVEVRVSAAPPAVIFHSVVEVRSYQPSGPALSSVVEVRSHQPSGPALSSVVEVRTSSEPSGPPAAPSGPALSSVVEVRTTNEQTPSGPSGPPEEPAGPVNNLLGGVQQYDFLSKQPVEVVDETYKVYDLRPPSKSVKSRPSSSAVKVASSHPTGLLSSMVGTVVREGVTTVHETRVLGTFVSGKYATVLQSTSTIKAAPAPHIRPTQALRILKTAAPTSPPSKLQLELEPTPAVGGHIEETAINEEESRPLRRSASPGRGSEFLARLQHRSRTPAPAPEDYDEVEATTRRQPSSRIRPSQTSRPFSSRFANSKYGRGSSSELATVSVFTETPRYSSASAAPGGRRYTSYNRNRSNAKETAAARSVGPSGSGSTSSSSSSSESGYTRRGYKPRHSDTSSGTSSSHVVTSAPTINKFKLSRPAGRWQYKTSPKPRVTIRQQQRSSESELNDEELNALTPPSSSHAALTSPQPGAHDEVSGPATEALPSGGELQAEGAEDHPQHVATDALPTPTAETIKVSISTPADFSDVYFEIATIRSPYTFQVGSMKNTRFITVTSTFERNLASNEPDISPTEPLTENILATSTTPPYELNQLPADASVATLPAILLASDVETPPLETVTETFNTTQLLLKTHILPVIHQGSLPITEMYTLVQSYHVTRFVTAVKTLPPSDAYQFLPSRSLNEFNSRLDEAGSEFHELEVSENDQEDGEERRVIFPPDLDLASVGGDFDVERLQKQKTISPTVTSSSMAEPPASANLSPELQQQLALLRYLNPLAAIPAVTTSKPIFKLETIFESHVIPVWNGLSTVLSTISRPVATVTKTEYEAQTVVASTPPIPGFGQQFTLTSTPIVTQTVATVTESKILKLAFGAKTIYSTLFSTRVVPTVLTTYVTTQVAVAPSIPPYPGYFPGGFPPFPHFG